MSSMHDDGRSSDSSLQRLRAGLRQAQARLQRQRVRAALSDGLNRSCTAAVYSAAIAAGLILLGRSSGAWSTGATVATLALSLLAALVPPGVGLFRTLTSQPDLEETAQRLDLATGNHNRIATALELSTAAPSSSFAAAAVEDGLSSLRTFQAAEPALPAVRWQWRRDAGLLAGALALALVALWLPVGPLLTLRPDPQAPSRVALAPEGVVSQTPVPAPQRQPEPRRRSQEASGPQRAGKAADAAAQGLAGAMASASAANAAEPGAAVPAKQTPGELKAAAKPPANKPDEPGDSAAAKPKPAIAAARQQSASAEQQANAGSSMTGGKGSSAQRAMGVKNDWQSQERASDDTKDAGDDDIDQDQDSESRHRGGMQPMLQDRRQAPSRELGLSSGNKGPPGDGRGGPTPPKKSRGAGALLLGVPVPDFVHGRLLPGTSRLTRMLIPPRRMPADPAAPEPASPRSGDEPVVEQFEVPPDLSQAVRKYFAAFHNEPEADDAAGASQTTGKE